ncbi:hypothetical protein SAMN05216486_10286 [bacterium JGI 053]|nr:hypothetical protein SAMN05216486_10286 [bacterium JGI 053]
MSSHIRPILGELLFYKESTFEQTKSFIQWKHNRQLCPWFEHQLNQIRNSFFKFQSVAYDIQGVHDLGTDVVLRYDRSSSDDLVDLRFIAFQIKSHDDLKDPHYLKNLRSQWAQASAEYRDSLDRYYIVLCADIETHQEKIREIKKTLSTLDKVVVVDPAYALTFLRLSALKISSVVTAFFREEDEVITQAQATIQPFSPPTAAVALSAVAYATLYSNESDFDLGELADDSFVRSIYALSPDYDRWHYEELEEKLAARTSANDSDAGDDEKMAAADDDEDTWDNWEGDEIDWESADRHRPFDERWADDTDVLMDSLFRRHSASGRIKIDLNFARPLQALLLDASVRYGYEREDLLRFVMGMLGIMDRFGLRLPGEEDELPNEVK